MATVFKYKTPVSRNYAPGFVKCGLDGSVGNKGRSGNAVYFVDFDLDNSYDIEMALQKIEHNFILANDSIKKLEGREYGVNDLLLSNSGKCYRIIESSQDSVFNNFKYDIEFLGAIKNNTDNNIKHVRIYDVTGLRFYNSRTGKLIKSYDPKQKSCWVNNRSEKPYSTDFYTLMKDYNDDEDFSLYGAWFKMVAVTTIDDSQKFTNKDGLTGSSYSFSILLNSNKSYSLNGFPCEYSGDPIELGDETHSAGKGISLNFKKKLEFPNITVKPESFFIPDKKDQTKPEKQKTEKDILMEFLFNEVTKPGAKNKVPLCTTTYMSDYSMDSYHPFGNNIMCTLSADGTMWYKSGVNARTLVESGHKTYKNVPESLSLSEDLNELVSGGSVQHERLATISKHLEKYGAGLTFTQTSVEMIPGKIDYNINIIPKTISSVSEPLDLKWFPQYAIGQSISNITEEETQEELDQFTSDASTTSGLLLYPKYPITSNLYAESQRINYKGGNSLFFSGIDKYEVPYAISNFVTNSLNTFQCVVKSAATKEVVVTEVPVLIDTSFRNKSFYISFVGDDEDKDDSFYNDPEDAENDDPTPPSNRDDEDPDKEYKHFWSFKSPIHIPYMGGGNSVTVYFITNMDITDGSRDSVVVSINDSEDIIPSVKTLQDKIFEITIGAAVSTSSVSDILPFLKEAPYNNGSYKAVPVTVKADYTGLDLIETYVGIKLCAKTKTIKNLDVDKKKDEVISESIISYSNPELKPNVPDASIDDTIEKPDEDRNIYKLTVKHIIGTNWDGQISSTTYRDQAAEISQYYIAKTPYEVTYTILNTEKYYFLVELQEDETPETGEETVERGGKTYVKRHEITFEGKLKGDTVIGDDVIIEIVTFDVNVIQGNNVNLKDPSVPYIEYKDVPYGTVIEELPFFYDLVEETFERYPDEPNKDGGHVYDKDRFEYDPSESSIVTADTNVKVSAIPLDRERIPVEITIYYPNGPQNSYNGGSISIEHDFYLEYVTTYYPKFDAVINKHYKIYERYTITKEDGESETKESISILSYKGDPVPYTYDNNLYSAIIEDPTQYKEMAVTAYATFEKSQDNISGIHIEFYDWYNDQEVDNFIMHGEAEQYGSQTKPIYAKGGETINLTFERKRVVFESPSETIITDEEVGDDGFTYRIPAPVEGEEAQYEFIGDTTHETNISYNSLVEIKLKNNAASSFTIPIYNVSKDGSTMKKWMQLLIQTNS